MARAKDRGDPQGFRRLTGCLSGRAAKGDQGVVPGIEAALSGNAAYGLGGLFHGDGDKSLGGGFNAVLPHGGGERGQSRPGGVDVQGLVR